jgi:hypothetical protein
MLNPIIETVIGLVFVYLLLSMLCSTIQEWVAAVLGLRASTLEDGVKSILSNDTGLANRILAHPLIKGTSRQSWWDKLRGKEGRPSYISAEIFAKAFLAETGVTVGSTGVPQVPAAGAAGNKISPDVQKVLDTLATFAPAEIDQLRKSVEQWYNDAMDRVSGWYRRKAQVIILVIGAALAAGLNADSVMLAAAFWHDPTLRAATAEAATQYVKTHKTEVDRLRAQQYPSTTKSTGPTSAPEREQQFKDSTKDLNDTIADVQGQIGKLNLPFGWTCGMGSDESSDTSKPANTPASPAKGKAAANATSGCVWEQQPSGTDGWVLKFLGLLATTLAISQGAPFWFDLLQKLVNLRLSGDAPDEKAAKTQSAH